MVAKPLAVGSFQVSNTLLSQQVHPGVDVCWVGQFLQYVGSGVLWEFLKEFQGYSVEVVEMEKCDLVV